ncbi:GNAT family N-acetyltransferase [Paenibacillus sp. NPDC058071]|uniref:GNAT family N-acetyltransferase n=1 Tax=Paenibacillus sp. NPDC058071 TaxID=3346326 RepID=UPI0036DA0B39
MNNGILLSSALLRLCRTSREDIDCVWETEHHPDNRPFIIPWTKERQLAVLESSELLHAVIETTDGKRVGYLIIAGLKNEHRSVELVRIVVSKKGAGYGREAVRLVQRLAFEQLQAHRLWLDVKEHNVRARSLYESAGFVTEGLLRECIAAEEGYDSLIVMSMLRREYETAGMNG